MAGDSDAGGVPPDLDAIRRAFWDTSISYGVQPPLTDEMLEAAEQTLGVKLPRLFVELLRAQNGGYTASGFKAFPTQQPTSWADDHVPLDAVFGIGLPVAEFPHRGLLDNGYYLAEWGIPDGLVLLSGDGHSWIALDYRASGPTGEPSACCFDTDEGESLQLAASFEDFVRRLRPREDFDHDGDLDSPAGDHPSESSGSDPRP